MFGVSSVDVRTVLYQQLQQLIEVIDAALSVTDTAIIINTHMASGINIYYILCES